MGRSWYKYLFVINSLVIFCLVCAIVFIEKNQERKSEIPAFISTALVNSETLNCDFCHGAQAAVIIDSKSSAVLYEKNAHTKLPMASTTKIMTALAVIENSSQDDVIEVSKEASGVEGSSIYLSAGERITVRDLLYGLLLESGNDAATALAIGVFGSEQECVKYMNERAHSMGAVSTCFENVHGLDSENHYTTAYELAVITKEAMKNSLFREIVSTKSYVTGGEKIRYFSNHNRLLKKHEWIIGVKTGYTSVSGRCLVSCMSRDGEEYVAVTLDDKNDWQDHEKMLMFACDNFNSVEIAKKDSFRIYCGFDSYVPADDVYVTSYGDNTFALKYKLTFSKGICKAEYFADGVTLGSFGMISDNRE